MEFQQFNEEYCRLCKEEDNLYHRLARHFSLSDSAFWILYVLEMAHRPITQAELSGYLSLSKQTIHSALKQLEREGQVRLSDGPGRRKYLQFTGSGQALASRTVRKVLELEEHAFLALTEEEWTGLLTLYHRHMGLLNREFKTLFNTPQEE